MVIPSLFCDNLSMNRRAGGWVLCAWVFVCLQACGAVSLTPIKTAEVPSHTSTPIFTITSTITASRTSTISATETKGPSFPSTITLTFTSSRTENTHKYVFPVQPQSAADFSSGGHAYPAIDIYAPTGTEFVAVTAGMVDFVSRDDLWNPDSDDPAFAGGLCVAIIGDDGIRYYGSHLSEVADGIRRGLRVKGGERLGLVGKSGNAAGTT